MFLFDTELPYIAPLINGREIAHPLISLHNPDPWANYGSVGIVMLPNGQFRWLLTSTDIMSY
jgi:hypothetical protein